MNNQVVVNQVLILFFIIALGFIARKKNVLSSTATKDLTSLLMNVTCPFTIFTSFRLEYSRAALFGAGQVLAFAVGFHLFALLLGLVIFNRQPEAVKRVLRFTTTFSNCGFMGFPLLQSVYGKNGIFYASFYVMVFNLFLWTVGIRLFSGKREEASWQKVLANPNLIAVGLGLISFLLPAKLPDPVYAAMEIVGAMNTPLSMLLVGATLTEVQAGQLFAGWPVYYGSIVRLLIMPFIALITTGLLNFPPLLQGVCVLSAATPAAALTTSFAAKYDGDTRLSSRMILLSTLFSVVTLPFFAFLVNR
ncbi:MAG: AEC family transporter [Firmicutes bacterium]|nr:AEC family transporter [Bacillota bacterium]